MTGHPVTTSTTTPAMAPTAVRVDSARKNSRLPSLLLGVAFYPREARRIEAAVTDGGPTAPAVRQGINRVLTVNAVEVTILLLVVVDMAVKPGA